MNNLRDRKASLKEIAYNKISEYILNNNMKPGSLIPTEVELSNLTGTSRTPTREALSMLEQEGVIEIIPRKGIFITSISVKDIQELFQLRESIEGMAARLAATRIEIDQIKDIEKMLKNALKLKNTTEKLELFFQADNRLHSFILEQSRNMRLIKVSKSYSTILGLEIKVSNATPGVVEKFQEDHKQIINALKARDQESAESTMREHINNVYKNIVLNYENTSYQSI